MKITASIVTYNNENEILKLLECLGKVDYLRTYVVDNNSYDKTVEIVKKFPDVELICLEKNIGYGGGHNRALDEIVESDYHIFINPDIFVEKNEIDKMIEFMNANNNVAILTPLVMNTDGTIQHLPKKYPKIKYMFGSKLENKFKWAKKLREDYTMKNYSSLDPIHIDFCTGCFMFCRMSDLKKVGGFDERYFLYFEDADLTREMQKYGETMYVPTCSVIHEWKRESSKSFKAFKISLKSMFKYFKKWRKSR